MGYTTTFLGAFTFSRPLTHAELSFLTAFSDSRRMKLDPAKLQEAFHGLHSEPYTRSYGPEGAYFTQELLCGDPALLDHNEPPGQPSLWCHWRPTATTLVWNGAEKFYNFAEWLEYLVDHFFAPWGVQLNGAVQWTGEDPTDCGVLSMRNNFLHVHYEDAVDSDDGSQGGCSEGEFVGRVGSVEHC